MKGRRQQGFDRQSRDNRALQAQLVTAIIRGEGRLDSGQHIARAQRTVFPASPPATTSTSASSSALPTTASTSASASALPQPLQAHGMRLPHTIIPITLREHAAHLVDLTLKRLLPATLRKQYQIHDFKKLFKMRDRGLLPEETKIPDWLDEQLMDLVKALKNEGNYVVHKKSLARSPAELEQAFQKTQHMATRPTEVATFLRELDAAYLQAGRKFGSL